LSEGSSPLPPRSIGGVGGVFNEYDFGLRVEVEVVAGGKASDQYTPFYHR